jgi:hypothetical protein
MYTSKTSEVTESFPGIKRANNTKNFFVHNQGG